MSVCVCVGLTPTSDNHPNHPSRPTTVPTRRSICQAISLKAQQVRQRVSQILDVGCWMLDAEFAAKTRPHAKCQLGGF